MNIVTKENIEEIVQLNGKVVITFSASWCGPCRAMNPVWDILGEKNEDVYFGKIDVDNDKELATHYNVTGVPTIITFSKGRQLHRQIGAVGKATLQTMIDDL